MKSILISLIFLMSCTTAVYADCIFEGVSYPTGTKLGSLVCMPDGSWQSSQ